MGPYAWEHHHPIKPAVQPPQQPPPQLQKTHLPEIGPCLSTSKAPRHRLEDCLASLRDLPRTEQVFRKIELDSQLSCRLPAPRATAGSVLKHAGAVFDSLRSKLEPFIFKFGITHDASFRWHNPRFGYAKGIDKFEHMVVLYAAADPYGPAFLEAALIQQFSGPMAVYRNIFPQLTRVGQCIYRACPRYSECAWGHVYVYNMRVFCYSAYSSMQGVPGRRNIRSGGDNIQDEAEEGPFLTYIVYRSFKFPPRM